MIEKSGADVVVELIGGSEGIARKVFDAALASGKHVVTTCCKACLPKQQRICKKRKKSERLSALRLRLRKRYSIIKSLREGLFANQLSLFMAS